jgi:uncharacterized membrane protein
MTTPPHPSSELLELERLVSLIDGVFAVALTLLVLDLKPASEGGDLARELGQMVPRLLSYLVAFASVAGYWTIHHGTFRLVHHGDSRLVLLSLVNLLFITLFPVAAAILGLHPLDPLATACLSTNSLLYCMSAWAVWSYAAANRRLLAENADHRILQRVAKIMLLVAIGLALAIPIAFLNVYLAYAIWILCAPISAWWVRKRWKLAT